MRIFVANVGVNTSDSRSRGLRSPIFPDGTFEFVPIKEAAAFAHSEAIPSYVDLPSWTGRASNLAAFLPGRVRNYRSHADPEFETYTYGDVMSPRAATLARIGPGDELWFLARLWGHDGLRFVGGSGFYFVARLVIEENLLVTQVTGPDAVPVRLRERIACNAHHRRLLAGGRESFRVLIGDPEASQRFARALAVTPDVVGHLYGGEWDPDRRAYYRDGALLRNKNGEPRSLETFGSVTRTIQPFLNSEAGTEREHMVKLHGLAVICGRTAAPVMRTTVSRTPAL